MARVIPRTYPGAEMRAAREDLKESQRQLCARLGVSRTSLIGYEQNGAPRWMPYALLGVAVAKLEILTLDEAREMARTMLAAEGE